MNEDINHFSAGEPIGYTSTGPDQSDKELFEDQMIKKLEDRVLFLETRLLLLYFSARPGRVFDGDMSSAAEGVSNRLIELQDRVKELEEGIKYALTLSYKWNKLYSTLEALLPKEKP